MHHPSVEGILHTTHVEEVRSIIHHADLAMTPKDRIKLLWQAFCTATTSDQGRFSWQHVRCISVVLLEELVLTSEDPDHLGVACGHVILFQNADPECFIYLLRYSLKYQSSPAVRAIVCWGLSTLPIHMHKELWEVIIAHLPQICLTCPLLLVWYWLLHCYEYNEEMGAVFLRQISTLADLGAIDTVDYYLLKSLTYTALLAEKFVFPFNKNIKIANIPKQALFPSDSEFILKITDKQVLAALMRYPAGEYYYITFLNGFEYVKKSANLHTLLFHSYTNTTTFEPPPKHTPSNPLIASLLKLIRQLTEYYVDPYSLIPLAHIELVLNEAIFSPEHLDSIFLGLQNMCVLPSDYDFSIAISINNFWIDPLRKSSWDKLDKASRHNNLIEILLILINNRVEWNYLQPWIQLFISIAGDLLLDQTLPSITNFNLLCDGFSIIDMLGAVHPILPIATLAHAASHISTGSLSLLIPGLQTLLSRGWISVFLKESTFSVSSKSVTEATGERKFITDTFYSLLLPMFNYPLPYIGPEMQLFDSVIVQGLLKALTLQIQWTGETKHIIELIKISIINEWLTIGQWTNIAAHAYQVLKVEASLGSVLKDTSLLEAIIKIGVFISYFRPDKRRETIDRLLDQLIQWHRDFHPKSKDAAMFTATSVKMCLAEIESNEEKAEVFLRILCHAKDLNDITLAVIDVTLNIERTLSTSTRDRLAMVLEQYIS